MPTGDTGAAVTLLVAPAGAGKTLGVSGWLRQRDRADDAVWVHADPTWDAARLAEVLGDGSRLVVIDDAHTLPSAALRLVDHRLTDAPETLRLLLLSRWDLPLTRLVPELLGHLTILRGDVLRMDDEEAAALIVEHSRSSSPEVVEAISEHAQGWCAAIVLTSRAVGAAPDPVAAANRYRHEETHIADRVATEVFAALHPRERHLLLCIAAEEVVSVPTAVLLTHDPVAGDVLADLEFTGLLVTRVGHDADAHYRIHPLLAEVVRRRLAVGGVDVMRARSTVSRAVHLDLARGDAERAFDRLVAVGESDLAADVLAAEGLRMVLGGQGPAIAAFVRRHADVVEQHPQTWLAVASNAGSSMTWSGPALEGPDPCRGGAERRARSRGHGATDALAPRAGADGRRGRARRGDRPGPRRACPRGRCRPDDPSAVDDGAGHQPELAGSTWPTPRPT